MRKRIVHIRDISVWTAVLAWILLDFVEAEIWGAALLVIAVILVSINCLTEWRQRNQAHRARKREFEVWAKETLARF
jgi:hypothetical protein